MSQDIKAHLADLLQTALFDRSGRKLVLTRQGEIFARHAMAAATTSLSTPDLHRWRKRVKDLWHLLALAEKRLPKDLSAEREDLARLGELLGQDHDHAVLAERLALSPEADPALMRQLAVIAGARRQLEQEAFALGRRLYGDKPKRFTRRVKLT